MKNIKSLVQALPLRTKSRGRNGKEDLIEQIVEQTTVKGKQADELRRLLGIATNALKWSETDLSVLLGKKKDPKVRNFTALVRWHAKLEGKKATALPRR